jgi:hypothetical protein
MIEWTTKYVAAYQCEELLVQFFARLDEADYISMVEMLQPSGIWKRGELLRASDGSFLRAMYARSLAMVSVHLLSNFLVEQFDSSMLEARAYLRGYRFEPGQCSPIAALPVAGAVVVIRARFRADRDGWRIDLIDSDVPKWVTRPNSPARKP